MHDRHERITSLLQRFAADFLREEANTDPLITVTRVSISPDYKRATVFITTYPDEKEEAGLVFMKRKGSDLRDYMKKHGKLKTIPHLEFSIDYGERHRQHIDEIAKDL